MKDYRKTIQNLLALAESPNENEARDALLKARELMAKYKIAESEASEAKEQRAVRFMTGITYSARRNPWVVGLAYTIAANHCARSFSTKMKGKQTKEIGIIALSDDIDINVELFKYAYDCVLSETAKLRREKGVVSADGYGAGFVLGLDQAYKEQQKSAESDWGLVLVTPQAVLDTVSKMGKERKTKIKCEQSDYDKGFADGQKFHEQKRIAGG